MSSVSSGNIALAERFEVNSSETVKMRLITIAVSSSSPVSEVEVQVASAEPWTFQNTPLTLRRFFKAEENDHMIIDLLIAGNKEHSAIIGNAVIAQGEHGIAHVADKSDIIWLKRQRNSIQDQADIERLENEED